MFFAKVLKTDLQVFLWHQWSKIQTVRTKTFQILFLEVINDKKKHKLNFLIFLIRSLMIEDKHLKKHCSLYFLLFFFLTKVHAMKKTKDVCRKVYYSASISKKLKILLKEKCSSLKQMHLDVLVLCFVEKRNQTFLRLGIISNPLNFLKKLS